ncbi:hypothetical protein J4447_04225 [Candidatus Pacearchaeota archaeon]|nr:hypothetical protein [Candidatus Pacearchaeota archaeon]
MGASTDPMRQREFDAQRSKLVTVTNDGLPVVNELTFLNFVREYPIASGNNDPEVTKRIETENPQIHRILSLGMQEAPTHEAKSYYEMGIQIAYELLRRQALVNSQRERVAKIIEDERKTTYS